MQGHIATIEHLLATTVHYQSRRELYHLLAQAQFLACGGRTNPERLTLTEKAVASAQQSGDTLLLAGMLSMLGQLYNFRLHQPEIAEQYLSMSVQLARSDQSLSGWVSVQRAESAAMRHEQGEMMRYIHKAQDGVITLGSKTDDRYYNTWSVTSFDAYQEACYIHLEDYAKVAQHFESTTMSDFSKVRRVVPFIDMAHTYTMLGDVNAARTFIIDALYTAQSTGHEALIPRIQGIAQKLISQYPTNGSAIEAWERLKDIPQTIAF